MPIKLIADSCCDITPALKNLIGLELVPLDLLVADGIHFVDDETLDIRKLLFEMKRAKTATHTACPSPEAYAKAMRQSDACVVVTLSSKLSGSYNAAVAGRDMVLEENPEKKIFILDSESAAAGETRLVLYLHELISQGLDFEQVTKAASLMAKEKLHTFFVLESLDNLIKNGRISKAAGVLGSMLSLRPVMCDDGHGNIACKTKVRGTANAMRKLVEVVAQTTADAPSKSIQLVLSQCNCADRAVALKKELLSHCSALSDVLIMPTGGVSTVYAYDGGIVVAF
ncbi:MAG: DegV family protein [Pygmaiobacter massiliensis]|nr:DegV family protein [Pygmaiobacter massiliensis]